MKDVGGADYLAELARFSPTGHQRVRFRAHDFRSRAAPRAHPRRAKTSSTSPTIRRSTCRRPNRSRKPKSSSTRSPRRAASAAASNRSARRITGGDRRRGTRLQIARATSPASRRALPTSTILLGGLQKSDLIILAARPGMGKTALATNMAFHAAREWARTDGQVRRRASPSSRSKCRPSNWPLVSSPSRPKSRASKIRRGKIDERDMQSLDPRRQRSLSACRSSSTTPAASSIAQVAARARRLKRSGDLGLIVVDYLQLLQGTGSKAQRKPRAGSHRDHQGSEDARQGTRRPRHRAVAALARRRQPRRQAPGARRPSRIRLDRTGRRRRHVRLPRSLLPRDQGADRRPVPNTPKWREKMERIYAPRRRPGRKAPPRPHREN